MKRDALQTLAMSCFDLQLALMSGKLERALGHAKEIQVASVELLEQLERILQDDEDSGRQDR